MKSVIILFAAALTVFAIVFFTGCEVGPSTYSVTYDGNGNTSGSVPIDNKEYSEGDTVTVFGDTGNLLKFNAAGISYRYVGWNSQADGSGIDYGKTFVIDSSNVTLYAKWIAYILQDTGPGGGLIFFDKGSYSDGWRYLEAAPKSTEAFEIDWYNASGVCTSISHNGCEDWFLPDVNQVYAMYENLHENGVGGFVADGLYWSSTEHSDTQYAYYVQFDPDWAGTDRWTFKWQWMNLFYVRAVRSF